MWRRTARDRYVIVFLLVATVMVLTLDFRTGLLNGLGNATTQIFGVFQAGVRTVAQPIESAIRTVGELGGLREENAQMREENLELTGQLADYENLARENRDLRRQLQIESTLQLSKVRARVTGATLSGLERSALINRGRDAGIEKDSAVLGPEGLIGRISWVGPRSARVLLITDSQSSIGVRIGDSGETALVAGTGGRLLRLDLIDQSALEQNAVREGDLVVTSGHQGGIYPPGIPIGRVERVKLSARGTSYEILVRPFARLSRLDVVSVARPGESRLAPMENSGQQEGSSSRRDSGTTGDAPRRTPAATGTSRTGAG